MGFNTDWLVSRNQELSSICQFSETEWGCFLLADFQSICTDLKLFIFNGGYLLKMWVFDLRLPTSSHLQACWYSSIPWKGQNLLLCLRPLPLLFLLTGMLTPPRYPPGSFSLHSGLCTNVTSSDSTSLTTYLNTIPLSLFIAGLLYIPTRMYTSFVLFFAISSVPVTVLGVC